MEVSQWARTSITSRAKKVPCSQAPLKTNENLTIEPTQQALDSWAEPDRIPISKRCNGARIDSACRVLLQSHFTRHTFSQREIWLYQIQWKCDGPSHLRADVPIMINVYFFYYDTSGENVMLDQKRF